MKRAKITVVGAGNVGASVAHAVARKELGDVWLIDIVEGLPQGKALDIAECGPVEGFDSRVRGTNDYQDTNDSDIVVITAGSPRKPGMSRDDLVKINAAIMKTVVSQVKDTSPDAILIIVSNPLDAMVHVAARVSGFPKQRLLGMAGVLDSTRFRTFVAEALEVSVDSVNAFVMGGHGDSMVPLVRLATVGGIPLTALMPEDQLAAIVERTRKGGGEFLPLLKTSAWLAPAASSAEMVEIIVRDQHKVVPCAAWLDGQFGVDGCFIGVPARLGAAGVEQVMDFPLTDAEQAQFDKTVAHVRELCRVTDELMG